MVPQVVSIGPNKVSQLERVHNVAVISKLSSLQMETESETNTRLILNLLSCLLLRCFLVQMKVAFGGVDSVSQPPRQPDRSNEQTGTSNALAFPVAFGGVDSVSQPPRQPDRSNEQTGTSNALAFPGSKSTQKGVTKCSCGWSNFTSKGLLCAKRQKMLEDIEKDFEGGQEADKFDGGGGSKSSGSLDIRFRVEKVQAPLCD
ncbi:hypothetical protein DY000_02038153 [Brassica cretica]|uniref:Uncharacterized protein n=1 Tax=Brassica cretica TaxID=69181 RepID=A0ABQ7B9U0_BRACR|nr:hypothetical protein DY000_02038153 [Brassica cretica]